MISRRTHLTVQAHVVTKEASRDSYRVTAYYPEQSYLRESLGMTSTGPTLKSL